MTLLFSDGFDAYSATADVVGAGGRWTLTGSTTSFSASGGVAGGGAYSMTGSGNGTLTEKSGALGGVLSSGNGAHFAGWFKFTLLGGSTSTYFLRFRTNIQSTDSSSNPGIFLKGSDGTLAVNFHGATTVAATSSAGVIVSGQWHHIEYAAKWNETASGGYIKVWVDRTLVINHSGDCLTGTAPSTLNTIKLAPAINVFNVVFDDILVWDEDGTDFVHTQLCATYEHLIETLNVDADSSVAFTPLSGSNYQNVDEAGFHDGDTSYNESSNIGDEDSFTVADQAATPAQTFAVAVHTRAKKTDAGGTTMRTKLKHGSTTQYSGDIALTTAYAHYPLYFGKNPDTAAAWGNTDVNGVEIGYKYQA